MRNIGRLTKEETAKVRQMAQGHPFYKAAMAMYDCTLLGEVPLLGYTAQNFFLDVISKTEYFFLETETGKVLPMSYFEKSWNRLCDELNEFDDGKDKKTTPSVSEDHHQQVLKVSAVVHAAESILLDYADHIYHCEGNKNLMNYVLNKYPDAARLKNRMKATITSKQEQLLKAYISEMSSEDLPLFADDYYDELYPDDPFDDDDVMSSCWHVADDKKEVFAKHLAQMLDEGVFDRRFHLPISRKDFISDMEIFFNFEEDELQELID